MLMFFSSSYRPDRRPLPSLKATALLVAALPAPVPASAEEPTFDCIIEPAQEVRVGSPVSGTVQDVRVTRGDIVAAGDVLAQLESSMELADVERDRVRAAATEDIEAQETRLTLSRGRLERGRQLSSGGHLTAERLQELEAEVQIAERNVANSRLQKRLAELDLARSEAALSRRIIHSPINGVVAGRHLGAGEYTNQETAIVTLVQLDPLHVETYVPVAYWGRIEVGATAEVVLERPVIDSRPAVVKVVDRVFDPASGTFGVRLTLENKDQQLPAGLRCKVRFDFAPAPAAP
jgi:RND family efflux transporter MFP subunit